MNSEPRSFPQAVPDLVFACVYLFLDLVHLINCVALPGKLCSNAFKFHVSWKVCRRQVPAFPQPPQPPCNIAAMQAEVGIVQSRSLERSHNVQKLESVQVQTAALSIKSHGKSRKCMWKHLWNKMKLDFGMFAYLHTLIHTAFKSQKWFA